MNTFRTKNSDDEIKSSVLIIEQELLQLPAYTKFDESYTFY